MNIFLLDYDIEKCAQAHVQKHVSKLILEAAQMMGTAIRKSKGKAQKLKYITKSGLVSKNNKNIFILPEDEVKDNILVNYDVYLNGYEKHPCTLWVQKSLANYKWLYELCNELNKECKFRGATKDHLSWSKIQEWGLPDIKNVGLTDFPRAFTENMRDECMAIKDPVLAYRHYYMFGKTHLLEYKHRKPPSWMPQDIWKYNKEKDLWGL